MTDRDHDSYLPNPNRKRILVYIVMMLVFGGVYFVLLGDDSSEKQVECDPDTDFTCNDPSKIIVRLIVNFHFMVWQDIIAQH